MKGIILFYGLLLLCVISHELGHYLTARFYGLTVQEFSIGFGPKLISWKKVHTQISVRLLPLGGYVRSETKHLKLYQKIIHALSGPFVNFLLFVLSLLMLFGSKTPLALKIIFTNIEQLLNQFSVNTFLGKEASLSNQMTIASTMSVNDAHDALLLFAAINLMLMLLNLLPIPNLDGGSALIFVIEAGLLRLGVSQNTIDKVMTPIFIIGFMVLLLPLIIPNVLDYMEKTGTSIWAMLMYTALAIGLAVINHHRKKV